MRRVSVGNACCHAPCGVTSSSSASVQLLRAGVAAAASSRGAPVLCCAVRHRLVNASALTTARAMLDPGEDAANKLVYARRRHTESLEYARKERERLARKMAQHFAEEQAEQAKAEQEQAAAAAAAEAGAAATKDKDDEQPSPSPSPSPPYKRSVDAFGDQSVMLRRSYSGDAAMRVIRWWEWVYWNYLRYPFTQELLIAKDRYGNKFTVTWQPIKNREEQRRMYRREARQRHLPYGGLATDDRVWVSWVRGQRGDPPSIAEEEHVRAAKREYMGAYLVDDEEVEDAMVRVLAHSNRSSTLLGELDPNGEYGDDDRTLVPNRQRENHPAAEMAARRRRGATWTVAFVRGDLFYNEEETQVMREELGHVFRNMEWQALEYKRQVRQHKPQHPRGLRLERDADGNEHVATDLADGAGEPMRHYWDRIDNDVPYHDAVPDLTTPMLERLRIEADQLEDERLALRKELGLTDLGDMREGRPPVVQDHDPFQPPPVSTRWKPRCWEESWGTGIGNVY